MNKTSLNQIFLNKNFINDYAHNLWYDSIITNDVIKTYTNMYKWYKKLEDIFIEDLKLFSDIDIAIIKDFYNNDLDKKATNIDKKRYIELFKKHFPQTVAWTVMVRQWIIKDLQIECIENYVFISFSSEKKNFKDIKFNEREFKNNRLYIDNKKVLIFKKPDEKRYWTDFYAYNDSLKENVLIMQNIKVDFTKTV